MNKDDLTAKLAKATLDDMERPMSNKDDVAGLVNPLRELMESVVLPWRAELCDVVRDDPNDDEPWTVAHCNPGEGIEDIIVAAVNALPILLAALTTLSARVETLEAQQLSVLTGFYLKQPAAVAEICDTVLDRSGALLGRVRDHAAEVKSIQALAGDTNHG